MKMAGYYMVVAQSYAPKEQTDKKWSELRGVSKARFTEATAGPNVFAGMTIILSDVQAQMIECSNYVRNNKAAVEARVTQSGALK